LLLELAYIHAVTLTKFLEASLQTINELQHVTYTVKISVYPRIFCGDFSAF